MTTPPDDYDPLADEATYPFQNLIGFRIAAWADRYARVELDLAAQHGNRYGLPHGGVHAALIDTAAGFAGSFCPWPGRVRRAMTLSLTINYLGQAKGSRLIAEGRVTGGGRKSFFAAVELTDETGVAVASAIATMRWRGNGGDPRGDPLAAA
jgi:uncharacterized protein (TIGR00369 family)